MVDKLSITEPDLNCMTRDLEKRLSYIEGAFYQFQFTLESSAKYATQIYRITIGLIVLTVVSVLATFLKVLFP